MRGTVFHATISSIFLPATDLCSACSMPGLERSVGVWGGVTNSLLPSDATPVDVGGVTGGLSLAAASSATSPGSLVSELRLVDTLSSGDGALAASFSTGVSSAASGIPMADASLASRFLASSTDVPGCSVMPQSAGVDDAIKPGMPATTGGVCGGVGHGLAGRGMLLPAAASRRPISGLLRGDAPRTLPTPRGLGLPLRERLFLGVPGGVRGGVTPFPFTRLSPEQQTARVIESEDVVAQRNIHTKGARMFVCFVHSPFMPRLLQNFGRQKPLPSSCCNDCL